MRVVKTPLAVCKVRVHYVVAGAFVEEARMLIKERREYGDHRRDNVREGGGVKGWSHAAAEGRPADAFGA